MLIECFMALTPLNARIGATLAEVAFGFTEASNRQQERKLDWCLVVCSIYFSDFKIITFPFGRVRYLTNYTTHVRNSHQN